MLACTSGAQPQRARENKGPKGPFRVRITAGKGGSQGSRHHHAPEWLRVLGGPGGLYDRGSSGLSEVCRHVPSLAPVAQPSPTTLALATSTPRHYAPS